MASPFMGADVKLKIDHKSLGRVMDMDSHEDVEHIEHVLADGNLKRVYPYADDIEHFRKEGMPVLAKMFPNWYQDYPAYANERRISAGMPQLYLPGGELIRQVEHEYLQRIENCRKILEKDKEKVLKEELVTLS